MYKTKYLFTSSAGGHYAQLKSLINKINVDDYLVLTERTKIKQKSSNKIKFLLYGSTDEFHYILKLIYNFIKSLIIFIKYRPRYIISTGVHSTIPIIIIGKIFGSKIIYIESYAKVYTGTRTGKFIYKYKLYDYFFVQWKELLAVYPKAIYGGSIY
ncbi:PssD/Cps14F family polysaccharide biosynthesis glycosyltransferase [Senegalia massiliensis]|uniref:Polysaccharide biosynthesis protein n=1 Tax=Senegalia massiliensis TaxID=1720316 RepID=A0A845R3B9_9CLOT|nr:PssD/Cps14F family polysaccharide biosynthesis glycosyltransferase [Senegalia massiliensis]NBI07033.1 polysaccharide biosynthesis protein [Senegalia massiliensis]